MRGLSQIPYIAIDEEVPNLIIDDSLGFTGTGKVVAPFNMIEITGEQRFSSFNPNQHIDVSLLPLCDGQYWLFYLEAESVIDRSQDPSPYYWQSDEMTAGGDFKFAYITTRKPFKLSRVNLYNTILPYTYLSRQARTGVISGVNIMEQTDHDETYNLDNASASLEFEEYDALARNARNYVYGGIDNELWYQDEEDSDNGE